MEIVRHPQRVTVVIHTARPGVLIGVKGANIERIGAELQKIATKKVQIKIKEVKKTDTNAQIVAQNIARQLENRGSFRKAIKMSVANAIKGGAQGCKVRVSGRLGGADMSRTEEHKDGRVPLHTLRADIDYGFAESSDDLRQDRRQGLDLSGHGVPLGQERGRGHARAQAAPRFRQSARG